MHSKGVAIVKVSVDGSRCQGHTLCSMIAPDSFELDDVDGHASPVSEIVPDDQENAVKEAAHSCPEQAIVIE
jgi:ferredoxin